MGWGKIDDMFDEHPKVLAILDEEEPVDAFAAITLWTLCFTWAQRNTRRRGKTPGLLPSGLPRRQIGQYGRTAAAILVKHGLWDEAPDGGWMIHDFADYLPTAETRAARSEAGKRGAEARWSKRQQPDGNLPSQNGNQPSEDGKLPSPSQAGDSKPDGKRVANDGSRARARRVTTSSSSEGLPIPIPTPVPPSAGVLAPARGKKPINAGDVVAAYVQGAKDGGRDRPAESLRKRVGKQATELLADPERDPELVLRAAYEMGKVGWQDLAVQIQRIRIAPPRDSPKALPSEEQLEAEWKGLNTK